MSSYNTVSQNIRYKNPDPEDKANPQGFVESILKLKPAFNMSKGYGVPSDSVGALGDSYIDLDTNTQYNKTGPSWSVFTVGNVGTITSAANLGGVGLYDSQLSGSLLFKGISAGSNISLITDINDITISATDVGEVNTASNVGPTDGINIFKAKVLEDLQFRRLTTSTPANLTITENTDSIDMSVQGFILGAQNSGLPAAIQLYTGVGVGSSLIFKSLYSSDSNKLLVDYSPDNLNIVFTPKHSEQYSCYISGIGSPNSVVFWNYSISPSMITAFTLSDSSDKKITKVAFKVLFNSAWSYSAGSIALDVGYFPSGAYMDPASFVVLFSTGLSLGVVNQAGVWNAPTSYVVPALGSISCRLTNTGVTSSSILADLSITVHVRDI